MAQKQTTQTANWTDKLDECLHLQWVPGCLTKRKPVLIINDQDPAVTNFRPITSLPLMWKLLTAILGEELCGHLEKKSLLPDERKGCRRNSRDTKDQLLINKTITRNCKRRLTELRIAWIDFNKEFDMMRPSWLLKCLTFLVLLTT